jgi:hypothetical protein
VPGIDGFLAAEQDRPDIPAKARMAHAVRVPRPDPIDVDAFLEACRGQGIRAWRKRERMPKVVRRITFWSGTLAVIAGLYLALTGWPAGRRSRSGRQIGLVRPGEPQALDLILERAVLDQARRLDAAANGVRREARRGIGGVGIRAHQLPGARPLQLAALEDQAVDALATSAPSHEPALHLGALARHTEDMPCKPRRPENSRIPRAGEDERRPSQIELHDRPSLSKVAPPYLLGIPLDKFQAHSGR